MAGEVFPGAILPVFQRERGEFWVDVCVTPPPLCHDTDPPSATLSGVGEKKYSPTETVAADAGGTAKTNSNKSNGVTVSVRRTARTPSIRSLVLRAAPAGGSSGTVRGMHRIVLIAGDGIGPEVAAATRTVLDATGVSIAWDERAAGASALATEGALLPEATLDAIRDARVAIKGPITTPVGEGFRSVNVALRQDLDLFAAVRPARTLPGVRTRHHGVDLVVVRENTEDLYRGIEFAVGSSEAAALRAELRDLGGFEVPQDAGITLKPISVSGARRIVRFAFEYARANHRRKVTVGHKANVMRYSDGIFLRAAQEDAAEYPDVPWEDIHIDHLSARLVRRPEDFDVLLLPNLYGDILSDLCAGLVGGLGLIPGANIGWEYAVFEPVHGSAPDIAGRGVANPIAMVLSGAMMLRYLGELDAAARVERAVDRVLVRGDVRTGDLGGDATTTQMGDAIAAELATPAQ
jgi:isocitrate dehydrogenase (NAD+)